jgi:asparagine synthase (glutamine-hydrolysing)
MTHFDFKTLLPALLHVEDRMSMAHGVESRVPFLDHALVELVATIPANIKFKDGNLKRLLRTTFRSHIPTTISERQDKKGFPVPLSFWIQNDLKEFIRDIFSSKKAQGREYLSPRFDISSLIEREGKFSRKVWALLCLELWQQEFHDKAHTIKNIDTGFTDVVLDTKREVL